MTRKNKRRSRAQAREPDFYADTDDSTAEAVADMRDLLLHLLAVAVCPECHGLGRVPLGNPDENGKREFEACSCRLRARAFLEEFSL